MLTPRLPEGVATRSRLSTASHGFDKELDEFIHVADEFTFRFNHRRSTSRGKLFFRLVQQTVAVALDPILYAGIKPKRKHKL